MAAWVNDRPVIALRGSFPLYRDLGEGDTGNDVAVLQQALADLGYGIQPDGVFGHGTARALGELYKAEGSSAPTRPVDDALPAPAASVEPSAGASAGTTPAPAASPAATPRTEIYLPLSEVLVLPSLPVAVDKVPGVGTVLTPENATLATSDGGLTLTASLTGPVAVRLTPGMTGTAQLGDASVPVTVSTAAPKADAAASGGAGADATADPAAAAASAAVSVTLTAPGTKLPEEWEGRTDVLITLDLTKPLTGVLLVPGRAVATAADGSSTVLASEADGTLRQVAVTELSCVSGTCALGEPKGGTGVSEGTQVRVDR